jgi:hypothetical protein
MITSGMGAAFTNTRAIPGADEGVDYVRLEGLSDLFISEVAIAWPETSTATQVRDFVSCVLDDDPTLLSRGHAPK